MKTFKLSTFDPNSISGTVLQKCVESVQYDDATGVVGITYTDQTTKSLGSITPTIVRNLINAELVNDELILSFDNGSSINLGDVSNVSASSYPAITGTGILTDAATGQHKTLVSTDPNLTITPTATELQFSANLGAGGGDVADALSAFKLSTFQYKATGSAGIFSLPSVADTFTRRTFNDTVTNGAGVGNNDGVITLSVGSYYLQCKATAYKTGSTYLCVRKVSNQEILLMGNLAYVASNSTTNVELSVSGYVNVTETTDVEVVQYTELGNVGGLVTVDLVAAFDLEAVVSVLSIYKVAASTMTPVTTPADVEPSVVTAMQNMVALYGDRSPVERKIFDEFQVGGTSCVVEVGDWVYIINEPAPYVTKWHKTTNEIVYIPVPEIVANSFKSMVAVGTNIYLIPYSATAVGVFDTLTDEMSFTTFGASLSGGSKWIDAIYCPTANKIYGIPSSSADFLIIDLGTQTATRSNLSVTMSGATKFFGAVYVDLKIYCIPYSFSSVVIINTATNIASSTTYGLTLTDSNKWWGGVYHPAEQKIVGIPHTATDILVIDLVGNAATRSNLGATLTGATKWRKAVGISTSGKIYAFPGAAARDVLEVDLSTNTATRLPLPSSLTGIGLFESAVQVGSSLYCSPNLYTDNLVKIDLDTRYANLIDSRRILVDHATGNVFQGMVRSKGSVVYTAPSSLAETYVLDLPNDRITKVPIPNEVDVTTLMYYSGATDEGGNVYFAPYSAKQLLRVVAPTVLGTERVFATRKQNKLVPIMNAYSQDGYVVTTNSDATYVEAYKVFNGTYGIPTGTSANVWSAPVAAGSKWVQIELPTPKKIHGFRYRNSNTAYINSASLLCSVDGLSWVEVLTIPPAQQVAWRRSTLFLIDDLTEYKYFKFEIYETTTGGISLAEVELLEDAVDAVDLYEVLYNVRANCPFQQIIASTFSSGYPEQKLSRALPPSVATDGWVSANVAGPHYINFTFKEAVQITSMEAWVLNSQYPNRFILEATHDGVTYDLLLDVVPISPPVVYNESGEWHFTNTQAYKSYRLTIYATDGLGVRMGRLSLRTPTRYDTSNWWGRAEVLNYDNLPSLTDNNKWAGAAKDPNSNKIYFIPYASTDIGILDPVAQTFVRTTFDLGGLVGSAKYIDGCFSPYDGKLYCIPQTAVYPPLTIDPVNEKYTQGFKYAALGHTFNHAYATLGPDGNIYGGSRTDLGHLTIDTSQGFYSSLLGDAAVGTSKHLGISLGPNGKLYQMPYTKNTYGEIDPIGFTTTNIPTMDTTPTSQVNGSALISNGNIIVGKFASGTALNKACFYVLDFGEGITIDPEIINHPSVR